MNNALLCLVFLIIPGGKPADPIETTFKQVYPPAAEGFLTRSAGQKRAVVLIHGIGRAVTAAEVRKASFHSWQKPGSTLVGKLSSEADVFAFAYGQNASVDDVAESEKLVEAVGRLRKRGYSEIILIGHSAGGLVARLFVEDHPDIGVTKVIQVCAPNAGSPWANAAFALQKDHEVFGASLSKEACQRRLESRKDKKIPVKVEFVCLVATGAPGAAVGDGVISCACQWSEDMQAQGIPAVALAAPHFNAMRGKQGAALIAELVRSDMPRWTAEQVAEGRSRILRMK